MKTVLAMLMAVSVSVLAGYTYTYTEGMDFGDLTLNNNESILVAGGEGHYLTLLDYTYANILTTKPLISEGNGGIWQIIAADYSKVVIVGGGTQA